MTPGRMGQRGGRCGHRQVFVYRKEHEHRMGHCSWLPKSGDLCLRTEDAGDWFPNYVALRKTKDGKYQRVGKFGAYVFGKAVCTLDERTFHLACAGEPVQIKKSTARKRRSAKKRGK